jgi:hypothetical protein
LKVKQSIIRPTLVVNFKNGSVPGRAEQAPINWSLAVKPIKGQSLARTFPGREEFVSRPCWKTVSRAIQDGM